MEVGGKSGQQRPAQGRTRKEWSAGKGSFFSLRFIYFRKSKYVREQGEGQRERESTLPAQRGT